MFWMFFMQVLWLKDSEEIIEHTATFYVIENVQQPLQGKDTVRSMGLIILGYPSTNGSCVNSVIMYSPFPKIKGVKIDIPID